MANISITAASVLPSALASIKYGTAGATITAGQPIYKDSSGLIQLADANVEAAGQCDGIALNGASAGQPISYTDLDPGFTPGATLTVGQVYCLSATAGAICPVADLTTGDYPNVLFIALTTAVANLKIVRGSAAKP